MRRSSHNGSSIAAITYDGFDLRQNMHATQHVFITRPLEDAQILAQTIRIAAAHAQCIIAPAMKIVPTLHEGTDALPPTSSFDLLLLTSRHAVAVAAAAYPQAKAICVGGSTTHYARNAGLKAVSADGTAADVIACVQKACAQRCLHLHGQHTRGDIAANLNAAGIQTATQVVYRQDDCKLSLDTQAQLHAAHELLVPVYSPRSAQISSRFLAGFTRSITLIAISEETGDAWSGPKPVKIVHAKRPNAQAMLEAIVPQVHKTT